MSLFGPAVLFAEGEAAVGVWSRSDLVTGEAQTPEIKQQPVLAKLSGDGEGDLLRALGSEVLLHRVPPLSIYIRGCGAGRRASFT